MALDVVVDTAQVIVFGIGALKKDCLLTGMAPVKLSPLILGPIVSILAVGILRDELYWEMFFICLHCHLLCFGLLGRLSSLQLC